MSKLPNLRFVLSLKYIVIQHDCFLGLLFFLNGNFDVFQKCILKNCEKLIELVVVKLQQDWFPLLELLAMVLNPHSRLVIFFA